MKKILALILTLCMILCFVGCGTSPKPEDAVKDYFITAANTLYENQAEQADIADSPINWVETMTKDFQYTIINIDTQDSVSKITIKVSNKDLGTGFGTATTEYLGYAFGVAFSDNPPSEEEMEQQYTNYLIQAFEEAPMVSATGVIELELKDKAWVVKNVDENIEDIVTGRLFSAINDLANSFNFTEE